MPPAPPVFVSYSRKDYYFAESLTFHLLQSGVQAWMDVKDLIPGGDWERDLDSALDSASALVLVVSPSAMASERVRAEWQRALARGCRIVLAQFRTATIPPELAACETADFRGRFAPSLRVLTSYLATNAPRAATKPAAKALLPLPPWVLAMTLALAIPTIGYFLGATWEMPPDSDYRTLTLIAAPFGALALVWFFCVAFVRRRMGMTRLLLCLACLAVVFALPALAHSVPALSVLATPDVAARFDRHLALGLVFLAVPIAGLGVLLLVRPEDLLRWTPTGRAWLAYRIGNVAGAAFVRAELASRFAQVGPFELVHDPVDAPMAQRLREQLTALGNREAAPAAASSIRVLLLTNRTQLPFIEAHTARLQRDVLTVIGSGIDVAPVLDWLWRRQWVDFRRWDVRRGDRARALPQVPEAVTQTRLPAPVARVHHVLCAVAALVFTVAGAVSPDENAQSSDDLARQYLGVATFAVSVAWALIAHWMVKRSRTGAALLRVGTGAAVATAVVLAIDMAVLPNEKFSLGGMAVAVALLAMGCAWLLRARHAAEFWLPQEKLTKALARSALGRYRDWNTLLWVFAYAFVFMAIFGFA